MTSLSLALSLLVKYGGRYTSIPANPSVALVIVFTPVVVLMSVLYWRYWLQHHSHANNR
ncbi:MAG: hypothetical protein VKL39_13010 [Leptolyngbyaceae bacterium]|nr:hypothetical protein [Leptolyngbyaceae bacterium]